MLEWTMIEFERRVDILSVPFLHSFEWLMVQSMDLHALLPSLLGGLLGLLLFPNSAFYFHSSNKPFYLIPRVDRRGKREN